MNADTLKPCGWFDLCAALRAGTTLVCKPSLANGAQAAPFNCQVTAIEAEDGSRRKWNVDVLILDTTPSTATVFWDESREQAKFFLP